MFLQSVENENGRKVQRKKGKVTGNTMRMKKGEISIQMSLVEDHLSLNYKMLDAFSRNLTGILKTLTTMQWKITTCI